jgi:adenylate cyclase
MILTYPGIIANLDLLENVVAGSGIVNTLPEIDGVNRRMPLVVNVNGTLYASLSLEILKVAANDTTFQVKLSSAGVEKLRIPNFGPITTDNLGRIWVDFSKQSVNVSLTDMPRDFAKSIVIVGITAAGIGNPVPTSIGSIWPHEMQASVLSTMIDGTVIQRPVYADLVEVTAILVLGLLILSLSKFVYIGLTVSVIFIVAALIGSYYTFFQYLYLLDGTFLSLSLLIIMLHVYSVKFISEFLQKMQIKKQFGTYLSPAMVEKLQKDPDLLKLGGESKELSIMFTDVRGFTSISEHYGKNVQGLTEIMNRYMTAMTASIINNNGTLDKYIGLLERTIRRIESC